MGCVAYRFPRGQNGLHLMWMKGQLRRPCSVQDLLAARAVTCLPPEPGCDGCTSASEPPASQGQQLWQDREEEEILGGLKRQPLGPHACVTGVLPLTGPWTLYMSCVPHPRRDTPRVHFQGHCAPWCPCIAPGWSIIHVASTRKYVLWGCILMDPSTSKLIMDPAGEG